MQYLRLVLKHWLILSVVAVVAAASGVGASLLSPQLYSSEVKLLIVQKQQEQYTDPYTSQKAAQALGTNLVSVVSTFDFLNRVIATGYVSPDIFSQSTKERKKQWQNSVKAQIIPETGIIDVFGYGTDPGKAEDVAIGVMQVLTTNASDYYGGSSIFEIKQIDGPITSVRPVKPNLLLNGGAAALLGLVVTYIYFLIRHEVGRQKYQAESIRYTPEPDQLPPDSAELFPIPPVEYRVLGEPVSMHDHINSDTNLDSDQESEEGA